MKPEQRIINQINHMETDFIPYAGLNFQGDVKERLDSYYGSDKWYDEVKKHDHIKAFIGPKKPLMEYEDIPTADDLFGSKWRVDRRPRHIIEPALKEPDLKNYRFPKKEEFLPGGWKKPVIEKIKEYEGYFTMVSIGAGLFERSWMMRGFMEALTDCAANTGFYKELVEKITDLHASIIEEVVTLPVDGVKFSDDWGDQRGVIIGPDKWRKYFKKNYKRLYEIVHDANKFVLSHCCGSVKDIMPDLIEIGLDVIQSVQPEAMDPYELKKEFGKDMVFWGGLGSQHTVPFGSPEEIKEEVAKLCNVMGKGGGYILGPAKALQPETPTENAVAVVEAFLDHGTGRTN